MHPTGAYRLPYFSHEVGIAEELCVLSLVQELGEERRVTNLVQHWIV
jgi:hypothetical protein